MALIYIGLTVIIILSYLIYTKHKKRCQALPPGPPSLPIVGSIPFLKAKRGYPDAITKECQEYHHQKLYTVWMGPLSIVVIQDFALAKDLFSQDEFSSRPNSYPEKYVRGINGTPLGIVATKGKFWQEQRRFTLKHLKDLGFGRNKLDEVIQEEVNYLLEDILIQSKYGDILVDSLFNFPIINILWKIVASKRYDPNLPDSKKMMKGVGVLFNEGPPVIGFFIQSPVLRKLIPTKVEKGEMRLKELLRNQILEHEKELKLDPTAEPKDFIDIYLKEIEKTCNYNNEGDLENFNTEQLVSICMDLFQAGSETSSTTLSWAILILALHPDVQEKCHEEISATIGGKHIRGTLDIFHFYGINKNFFDLFINSIYFFFCRRKVAEQKRYIPFGVLRGYNPRNPKNIKSSSWKFIPCIFKRCCCGRLQFKERSNNFGKLDEIHDRSRCLS